MEKSSHQFAIAKASFSAGLLRPDPTSLSRADIEYFHSLLNATAMQCTPRNVQQCKHWILENIVQSAARVAACGKYLAALASSFAETPSRPDVSRRQEPSNRRKRLHLLYIINDLLYHAKYRVTDASVCSKVQPVLVSLFSSAASFQGCPKHHGKLMDLLHIWEENNYYSTDYIEKLRQAVTNASEVGNYSEGGPASGDRDQSSTGTSKPAPYVMPAMHGDPSTPWFDLPAGNLMPHIVPNSTRPINPDMIKPLQFVAGPADEDLVVAVKSLMDEVQTIFETQDEKTSWDIDELGQPVINDEITGGVVGGECYYGWSRTFCEKMNKRKAGSDTKVHQRGRPRSRSRSQSPSGDGRKRRYSDSNDGSNHSYSSSRSPSVRHGGHNGSHSRDRSYSASPRPSSISPRRSDFYSRERKPVATAAPTDSISSQLPPQAPLPFGAWPSGPQFAQQPYPPFYPPPPGGWGPGVPPPPPPPPPLNPSNGGPGYPPAGPGGGWQPLGYNRNGWQHGRGDYSNRGRGY